MKSDKPRILVVDDEVFNLQFLTDLLIADHHISTAKDGLKALQLAASLLPDLVILDVVMPGMDGYEVCRQIRSKSNVPVILITARGEDFDKIMGLDIGADDYIVKPFSPSELVARVNAHISRYERLTSIDRNNDNEKSSIIIGRIKILLKARRVYIGEEEVRFANKEFELLLFLASNPNIVFSKETLLDRIWGEESFGDSSTVTVHINRIRDKIEVDSSNPKYIETVWGAGYRFNL